MNYCVCCRLVLALLIIIPFGCRAQNSVSDELAASSDGSVSDGANDDSVSEKAKPDSPETLDSFSARVFSWNVESEGANPSVIATQLGEFSDYDVFALCEVLPQSVERYKSAVGENFGCVSSKSGHNDRLVLLFDSKRFELVRDMELHDINSDGNRHRSPLVVHLKDRSSGKEFLVMNNHLARGDADFRTEQARRLVEWARDQSLPVIAVGDYNFDFVFETEKGNDGFVAMQRDNIWKWIRPTKWIDTNWYDPEPDGVDNYPGSMLDFAFLANGATEWKAECNVIVRDGDFPDSDQTSDHRPFELVVSGK